MKWTYTAFYVGMFVMACAAFGFVIANDLRLWPIVVLLIPLAAWAVIDIRYIWKGN